MPPQSKSAGNPLPDSGMVSHVADPAALRSFAAPPALALFKHLCLLTSSGHVALLLLSGAFSWFSRDVAGDSTLSPHCGGAREIATDAQAAAGARSCNSNAPAAGFGDQVSSRHPLTTKLDGKQAKDLQRS